MIGPDFYLMGSINAFFHFPTRFCSGEGRVSSSPGGHEISHRFQ